MFRTALSLIALVLSGLVALPGPATAASPNVLVAPAAINAGDLGMAADTAAGSCWEIKQRRPDATDGAYWLLTPAMSEPQRFYCDMTTDGGGWVLVGKGRDGWQWNMHGRGSLNSLLDADTSVANAPTAQYPGRLIDDLLNHQRVDQQTDGVRLRRATNTQGTSWQEVRMRFSMFPRWAWAFGALYPVSNWSFGTTNGSGGTSQNFGTGQTTNRVNLVPRESNNYRKGWAMGTSISGSNAATSYLWSGNNGTAPLPYTLVYLRPRITSGDAGFEAIPDGGKAGWEQESFPESEALNDPWGVNGTAGSTGTEGNVEVQAFTQSGNTMFVGGNFRYVQRDAGGSGRVQQSFLAAFNVTTGEWISSFRPQLNEQVRALATLPNGSVVAGGDFSQANGQPATRIVALNPTTGATDTSFKLTIENRKSAGVPRVNALEISDQYLYIGGSFTHFTGGTRPQAVYVSNIGRVLASNGTPSTDWNGLLNGTVNSLSGTGPEDVGERVYAAGYFTQSNGVPTQSAAAFEKASGAPLAQPLWAPQWSNNAKNYQRAINAVGNRVWSGGSEHNLFQFDVTTFQRTMGNIMHDKGDLQSIEDANGVIYAGCHCNYYDYENTYGWPNLTPGWTRADSMTWFGAYRPNGTRIAEFEPAMSSRLGSGVWATIVDTNGVVWAGGDITNVATSTSAGRWAGAFVRFPQNDSTAPPTPRNLRVSAQTATTVTLRWDGVSDPSGVRYQVLRDDRPIAATGGTTITVPKSSSGRLFVRAADGAGNYSATSPVLVVGTGLTPPDAAFTWTHTNNVVQVDGSGSSSPNGDITEWRWDFGDGAFATGRTAAHSYTEAGSYVVTLTVTDSEGAQSVITRTVTVNAPPVNAAPADAYGKRVYNDGPLLYYRLGESGPTGTVKDSGPSGRDGIYNSASSIGYGATGAIANSSDTAITLNGSSGFAASPRLDTPPSTFTIQVWFKTTSSQGGRLIGYSNSNSGNSSQYDRHIYIQNDGRLVFGAYTGVENRVTSPAAYNDGNWHKAVATLSPGDGMKLYVDGDLVGTNSNGGAEGFLGYWRVGGDSLWSGATSRYLAGSLDEAAVYDRVLTAEEIEAQYAAAESTAPPVGQPPQAQFTAQVQAATVQLNASGSSDPDGNIVQYHWEFGDGDNANGQILNHTYPGAGTYTITLTVTDEQGLTDSATRQVTIEGVPVENEIIAREASWSWRYEGDAPPSNWMMPTFDASSWSVGQAPLGFGSPVNTNIDHFDNYLDRPRAVYFTRTFNVPDASKVSKLVLTSLGDDGVVIYVNGTEVRRENMRDGDVTHMTFAPSARRTVNAPLFDVDVPTNLLKNGTNVIAAETHLNYRQTPDMTFHLRAVLTTLQ